MGTVTTNQITRPASIGKMQLSKRTKKLNMGGLSPFFLSFWGQSQLIKSNDR